MMAHQFADPVLGSVIPMSRQLGPESYDMMDALVELRVAELITQRLADEHIVFCESCKKEACERKRELEGNLHTIALTLETMQEELKAKVGNLMTHGKTPDKVM